MQINGPVDYYLFIAHGHKTLKVYYVQEMYSGLMQTRKLGFERYKLIII